MLAVDAVIYDGKVHLSERLKVADRTPCVILVLDLAADDLRTQAQAFVEPGKQARLSALLALNRSGKIMPEQEHEMDELLAEVYELAARKARAERLLGQFRAS